MSLPRWVSALQSVSLLFQPAPPGRLVETVRRKYSDPAEVLAHEQEARSGLTAHQRRLVQRHLPPEAAVLDLGCAVGRSALGAAGRGHPVVATDVSLAMVQAAARLARVRGLPVRVCVMDAGALGFAAGSFDAVLMLGSTLSYIPRRAGRRQALREVWRVLRPGGRVLIETSSRTSARGYRLLFALLGAGNRLLGHLGWDTGWEVGDRMGIVVSRGRSPSAVYFHMYAPEELEGDLAAAGFRPVPVDTSLYLMHYLGLKP